DLTGRNPFGNVQTAIRTTRTGIPNYWALSGNPILINRPYMPEFIGQINSHGDWGFGVIHEFGHNFDSSRWNFDVEFFANFKMAYVVDRHNATVLTNYTGLQDLIRYYRTDANPSGKGLAYVDSIAKNIYHHDGLTYNFLMIQQKIGWEPFRQTFRYFNDLQTSQVPASNIDKLNLFLTKLSDFSNQDVFAMLTAQEKAVYEQRFGGVLQRYEVSEYKEPNEVTVEYRSSNHTSGEVPPKQIVETPGGFIVQDQGTLKRDGYTFLGWNNKGGDFIYKPGTTIGWDNVVHGMLYLDAVWEVAQPSIPTLSPDIEWLEYSIPELNIEMFVTVNPVVEFGDYRNVKLAITATTDNYYGKLHVLINDEWQFIGYILLSDVALPKITAQDILAFLDRINIKRETGVNLILADWNLLWKEAMDDAAILLINVNEQTIGKVLNTIDFFIEKAEENLPLLAEKIADMPNLLLERMLSFGANTLGVYITQVFRLLHNLALISIPTNVIGIEHRYTTNRNIEIAYENADNARGLIYHQRNEPHNNMRVGNTGNGGDNGCGPFSIYNAIFHLSAGNTQLNASTIIRDLEYVGAFNLGGAAGTNPASMRDFIWSTIDPNVDIEYMPKNLDDKIRDSRATILLYNGGSFTYLHYVMITPTPSGRFAIVNWINRTNATFEDSIDNWLTSVHPYTGEPKNYTPLAIIRIL
ncbi:MAG: M60 family metallopeptidase, partial [Firmicutes bacterium]|nr:M60 family metallopeptidase [Bacillota bacterium]